MTAPDTRPAPERPAVAPEPGRTTGARLTHGRLIRRRFLRNRLAVLGALGIAFLVFLAVFGPHILYWKFDDIDTNSFLMPPDGAHPLGTTRSGRDVLALAVRGLGKSLLIIDATLGVGYAILSEAGLSYFGFGVQPPDVSLGTLIGEGARMATTYPWVFLGPAGLLVLLVLCVNAVGDGLRDALDPASASGGRA